MFAPALPATPAEWLPLIAPLAALLVGIGFLLMPGRLLGFLGLAGGEGHPEAVGEGRSRFAGFMIALPVVSLLFGQPALAQTVGVAWGIVALGKLFHFVLDGGVRLSVVVRFALAVAFAALVFMHAGRPDPEFVVPVTLQDRLIAGVAAYTVLFGTFCFLLPGAAAALMRLEPVRPGAAGELRGPVAGFHLAAGLAALMFGGIFGAFALGVGWLATAFGRLVSILSDRASNLYNWFFLGVELALGALPLAVIFEFIG